jgi:hypothetical protein
MMLVNVSDHIRKFERVPIVAWHESVIRGLGFDVLEIVHVDTPRMRMGQNGEARVEGESIIVARKPLATTTITNNEGK